MTRMSFAEFVQLTFPDATITPLSSTNNEILRVEDKGSILSAKRMIDADVPVPYFVQSSEILGRLLPVPRIERIFREAEGDEFDCIVSQFVDGHDLAAALTETGSPRIADEKLLDFLTGYLDACRNLPPMFPGFGLYKRDAPRFSDHLGFLRTYARKYWQRVRPFIDGETAGLIDEWVEHGLRGASVAPQGFQPIAVDSNLRNFIVTGGGELVLLNVPIVGCSSRAHAVAAIAAHLRPFEVRKVFLDHVTQGWAREERAAIAHLEAWTLLGILSFYAVRAPDRPDDWRNWGATRGLRDDFIELIGQISRLAA